MRVLAGACTVHLLRYIDQQSAKKEKCVCEKMSSLKPHLHYKDALFSLIIFIIIMIIIIIIIFFVVWMSEQNVAAAAPGKWHSIHYSWSSCMKIIPPFLFSWVHDRFRACPLVDASGDRSSGWGSHEKTSIHKSDVSSKFEVENFIQPNKS